MIDMSGKIKWCVIYGQHETRNFKSEQEALKAYPVITNYSRTEYAESVVYRHPEWTPPDYGNTKAGQTETK
jgi:hypothetical protein